MKEQPETRFSLEWTTEVKVPAGQGAKLEHCQYIEPEHLLFVFLWNESAWIHKLIPDKDIRYVIREVALHFPPCEMVESVELELSEKAKAVLRYALNELADPEANNINPFYILVALLEMEGALTQETKAALSANNITPEAARIELRRRFGD